MAEWRERGYVPDSDEEEDEDFETSDGIQAPRQWCQSALPATRETKDHPNLASQRALDGLKAASRDGPGGLEAAPFEHHERSSSTLATRDTEGSAKTTEQPGSEKHGLFPASSASGWEEQRSFQDVSPMEIDHSLPSSPVEMELQAALNLGLKQVDEFLRDPEPQNGCTRSGSQSSSPLSSLVSLDHELGVDDEAGEPRATSSDVTAVECPTKPSSQRPTDFLVPQRSLRQRTQIQLHPYALEDARYQQELKARGLMPLRIEAIESQTPRDSLQSAGDGASLFSSSPMYDDSAPMSVPSGTQDEMSFDFVNVQREVYDHSDSPLRIGNDHEDLPDLATIFREGHTESRPVTSKRYCAAQTAEPRLAGRPQYVNVSDVPRDDGTTQHPPVGAASFFVPPSPPRSGSIPAYDSVNEMQDRDRQQNPTPRRLPTPLLSSGAHSRKRAVVALSDSLRSDSGAGTDFVSSSDEDESKVGRIKAMKRRMQGVLPASWLRLDLKRQTVREQYHRDMHPTHDLVDEKGIAKSVSTSRPQTGLAMPSYPSRNAAQFTFSDEDLTSDEELGLVRVEHYHTDTRSFDYRSTDVLEDNRIDMMQPTRERQPNSSSKPRRKRQQRTSDAWQNVGEQQAERFSTGTAQSHSTSRKMQHKESASKSKRQRKHKPAPRLTVLDAPGFVQLPIADQAQFLKVASRRAQQETRRATQSSRGKFYKLATAKDTGDINQILRHWQDGHIQPHHAHQATAPGIDPAADRSSLPPQTSNILDTDHLEGRPWTNSRPSTALDALKNSTDATVQRIIFKQQGISSRSSRTIAPPASTSHMTASLARLHVSISLRKPIPNRAGLGSHQATDTHTRVAQLEYTAPERPSTSLSGPVPSVISTTYQHINQTSTFQPSTNSVEADYLFGTKSQEAAQQPSKGLIVHRTRKSKAPQRSQSLFAREISYPKSSAGLPVAQASDRTSDELTTVLGIMAELSRAKSGDIVRDGWSVLWPTLQKWLEVYSDNPSIRTPSEKQQAKEIFQLCRQLFSKSCWLTAWDDLIRKAAWFFSAFDMVDPFDSQINPHIGLPPFLNEVDMTVDLLLPDTQDSTFYVFLDMLAISLTRKSIEAADTSEGPATDKKKKTELHSFVNRLYPNNGRLLSEHEEIRKIHLASLWNRCSLYLTLYCYTMEECRPRLSHFQNLVDVKKSHTKACEAILTVWGVLSCFHAKRPETSQHRCLAEMGHWMQSMILAMVEKWVEARQEVINELENQCLIGRDVMPAFYTKEQAMLILLSNQSSIEAFLQRALTNWTMAIGKCESQNITLQLLNIGQMDMVLENLMTFFDDNDTMFQHTLGLIEQYLQKYSTSDYEWGSPAQRVMLLISRNIEKSISRRLDSDSEINYRERAFESVINRRLTYDWSLVASALITAKERSWDDFLEPAGKHSWERFKDTKRSVQYQTLFISFVIKAKEEVYRDNKFWYMSYWVRALLRPSHESVFEHELTHALMKADQYEPILIGLPFLLQSGSNGSEITLGNLKHNKTAILGKIIEGIANASVTYDSQIVDPYALQPPEMADLLKVIMNTMRLTRSSLDPGSKEREEYETMVWKLAEVMERHTSTIVPIEQWLTDSNATGFDLHNLKKRFGGPAPATGTMLVPKSDISWFQHTCQKAAIEGDPEEISEALRSVYVDSSDTSDIHWYHPKMLAMMEQVFPAYVELALTDRGALMGAPILNVLDSICETVHMRAVSIGTDDYSPLLDALEATIISSRIAMQRSCVDRDVATVITFEALTVEHQTSLASERVCSRVLAFAAVVRIARIAVQQFRQIVRHAALPDVELGRITDHARYIYVFVLALYHCIQDGEEGHWTELAEADRQHLADGEADNVKQFAALALERQMRQDWSVDPEGTWWVMQGRAAVPVKRSEIGEEGIRDQEMRKYVKDQMHDYMNLFRDTSGRTIELVD